jgi:formylmethanofuran dehydrogenase subunit E
MENERLLEDGKRFHGHLGPYLALGLKAGALARERLKANPFKLKAEVHVRLEKPLSCFIDGVQVSSGCTMGKRNITAVDSDDIRVLFTCEQQALEVKLRKEAQVWIQSLKVNKENEEQISREIMNKKQEELFEII